MNMRHYILGAVFCCCAVFDSSRAQINIADMALSDHGFADAGSFAQAHLTRSLNGLSKATDDDLWLTQEIQQSWDGAEWVNERRTLNSYDNYDRKTEKVIQVWTGTAWENGGIEICGAIPTVTYGDGCRTVFSYDPWGNLTEEIGHYWNGFEWSEQWRSLYTYDTSGNRTEDVWQVRLYDWLTVTQTLYTHDESDNLVEELNRGLVGPPGAQVMDNLSRWLYGYDESGNRTELIFQDWTGTAWENERRYTSSFDSLGNMTGRVIQDWTGTQWGNSVDQGRWIYTYDSSGRYTEITLQSPDGANQRRHLFQYDGSGNRTQSTIQFWTETGWANVGPCQYWLYGSGCRDLLAYDETGHLTEITNQEWVENDWVHNTRLVNVYETPVRVAEQPLLIEPEHGEVGVPAFASFRWHSIYGGGLYHLQVVQIGRNNSTIVIDDSTLTDTTFTPVTPFAYGTAFWWRVRGALANGQSIAKGSEFGPWSEEWLFTVAVGTASEGGASIPTVFALHQNYPNPFNPSTAIRYDLPEAASVRLTVFDALGRSVEELGTWNLAPGTYTVTWDAEALPSGVYFVRMEAGAYGQTIQVLLMR